MKQLPFDPVAATAHVRASDPVLARVIDAVGPCTMKLDATPSLFAALSRAIVYQQLHAKAASTILGRQVVPALYRLLATETLEPPGSGPSREVIAHAR